MDRGPKMHLLAVLLCFIGAVVSQDSTPNFRLPSTVLPTNYILRLEPDLDQSVVNGTVIIDLLTNKNSTDSITTITLHLGTDSSIDEGSATLVSVRGIIITHLTFDYDNDAQTVQISLPDGAALGFNEIYVLTLKFTSPLYTSPIGIFSGSFNDTSKYVASAFRATFARNAFPCFDEPQIQAPITLQVVRPSDYNVISTAALDSSSDFTDTTVLDAFETTPAIPASALGFFMSKLEPVSTMGVNLYVGSGNTSSSWVESLITDLMTLVGSETFPTVQTLNLVVLPDMPARSFSSYGFVYTTPKVFYDEITAQLRAYKLKTQLAEALLQQWLAYAKTPAWWSHLWLTDSIAAYLANKLISPLPVLGLEETSIRSNGISSYTGPVVASLLAPLDIETAIAQQTIRNKGLSVLAMWRDTLPEGLLDKTINDYIELEQNITTTEDFLQLLDDNINQNTTYYNATSAIGELSAWLLASGSPFISVSSVSSTSFTLTQTVGCPDSSNETTLWPVSISFTQNTTQNWENFRQSLWLIDSTLTVPAAQDSWTILNLESAPYRTSYADWDQIMSALSEKDDDNSSIPVAVKASIQDDAIALALSGCLSWSKALYVLNSTEHAQADWLVVIRALDTISGLFGNDETGLSEWMMYGETLFSSDLTTLLDLTNSSIHTDQWYSRLLLTPWLCKLDLGNCRSAVNSLFQSAMDENSSIDPNDIDNVVCLGAKYNSQDVDALISDYKSATSLEMKRLFVIALGCLSNQTSIQTVLDNIAVLSPQDARDVLVNLASSVENVDFLEDFIVTQIVDLEQNILGTGFVADVITTFGQYGISLDKLSALVSNSSLDLSWYVEKSILETTQTANDKQVWFANNGQSLKQALPQIPTITTVAPATTNISSTSTTSTPSSAVSLMDLRVLSLVFTAALTTILLNL